MENSPLASNPFAFLMHPEAVLQAMERSDRLGRLQSRICRPLDKSVSNQSNGDVQPDRDDGADDPLA